MLKLCYLAIRAKEDIMSKYINFHQNMSGYYFIKDEDNSFTKEEAIFIQKALKKAIKEELEKTKKEATE